MTGCLNQASLTVYTAKLLFHQSPAPRDSDYTVTGSDSVVTGDNCWQHGE